MKLKNRSLTLIVLALIIIALPLLLIAVKQTLDNRTRAAAADKLETEGGVLSSSGASVNADTSALGGNYVVLFNRTNPTPIPTGEPNPVTCAGYPEKRVFIEAQDWWEPIPNLGGLGHIHMGMCFPVDQTVSGVVRFDMRVVFHGNKGTLRLLKMQDDQSTDWIKDFTNYTPETGIDSTYVKTFYFDTNKMPDGLRLFRWYADLTHDGGNSETARAAWPLRVENGKPDNNNSVTNFTGSGWYKEVNPAADWGYTTARIEKIPTTPVSGIWRPDINFNINAPEAGFDVTSRNWSRISSVK